MTNQEAMQELKFGTTASKVEEALQKLAPDLLVKGFYGRACVPIVYQAPEASRDSLNNSTDADEAVMATFVVPGNIGLIPGSMIEFMSLWEIPASASTKTFVERIAGASVGSATATTPSIIYSQKQAFHVYDANTLVAFNSFQGATGAGSAALASKTVTNIEVNGFTMTYHCKWSAPVAAETIRLKFAKMMLFPAG